MTQNTNRIGVFLAPQTAEMLKEIAVNNQLDNWEQSILWLHKFWKKSPRAVRTTFTESDLANGQYVFKHELEQSVFIQVADSNRVVVHPDKIVFVAADEAIIDLTSFLPIKGTWHVLAMG